MSEETTWAFLMTSVGVCNSDLVVGPSRGAAGVGSTLSAAAGIVSMLALLYWTWKL